MPRKYISVKFSKKKLKQVGKTYAEYCKEAGISKKYVDFLKKPIICMNHKRNKDNIKGIILKRS